MANNRLLGRALVASLAVGVTLTAAGCGSADKGPGYASSDSNAGGVAYADKALTKDQIMRVSAAAAKKAGSAHMTMAMTGTAKLRAKGDIDYGHGTQPAMSMTMSMPQMGKRSMEMRLVGGMLYMTIPGLTPPGKFVAINPKDKNSPLAKSFAGTTDQLDPMSGLEKVEDSVQSVDRVGKQTLGGVTVEHYELVVDTAALVKQMGQKAAQQAHLPKTITYDLWLDARHLPHRIGFTMSGTNFEATMSRWGKPVHVERPSKDQIATLPGV